MKHAAWVMACLTLVAFGASAAAPSRGLQELEWRMLLPEKERDGFSAAPPAATHDYLGESSSIAALQSGSYEINPDLDGALVKVPGFVVPLSSNAAGEVNEFFLVPYFGACIHVPPPPPNQIIYVKMREGAQLRSIQDAQWVTGRLHAEVKSSSLGAAAYTLDGESMQPYEY
jgi:hypothetical protein